MKPSLIIRKNSDFRNKYDELKAGDIVSCILNFKPCEEHLFVDLIQRGIILFPSATSQLATRSKCFQAVIFKSWMLPNTLVIRNRKDLVKALQIYEKANIEQVITKLDRSDCGLGICKWNSLNELFNHVTLSSSVHWPFVLQPFVKDALDIRVVWIGDYYKEAYFRYNPHSFRNNVHFGGESGEYVLNDREESLCRDVIERGGFPWAHIDLLKGQDGMSYLSEISLFGGLKGAKISQVKAGELKARVQKDFENGFIN